MKRLAVQISLGVLVLLAGVLLLLDAVGMKIPSVLWAVVLAGASATFGYIFFADRRSWWAAIPSGALLGSAIATLMDLDRGGLARWTAVPFLAALSAGFWAVYLRDRRRWWSLIPAGILLTLAIVTVVTEAVGGAQGGAIFLFGAAITFVLVAALPSGASRRWWAWIPAGVLALGGIAVIASVSEWFTVLNVLWPIAVISAGGLLIWRALYRRGHPDHHAPVGSEGSAPRSDEQ